MSVASDLTAFEDPRGPKNLPPAQAARMQRAGLITRERGRWVLTVDGLEALSKKLKGRAAGKLYEYVMLRRPYGFATVPSGNFVGHRPSIDPKQWPFGVVQYDKPLSKRDVDSFELLPLDRFDPINVRRVIEAWRDHVRERFVEGNREMMNVDDEEIQGFRVLTYSTRPGVDYQVTTFQRMGPRGKGRAEPTGHMDFNDFDKAADALFSRAKRAEFVAKVVPRA